METPITSPRSLKIGPPDEPGAIGRGDLEHVTPSSARTALMRPFETVSSRPSGCPMATMGSPACIASLSPSASDGQIVRADAHDREIDVGIMADHLEDRD